MTSCSQNVIWMTLLVATIGNCVEADMRHRIEQNTSAAVKGRKRASNEAKKRRSRNAPASNSAWGEWSEWSTCNVSCESGYATRVRDCLKADACFGMSMSTEPCEVPRYCKIGGWSTWSSWQTMSGCSATCGDGSVTMARLRVCYDSSRGCPGDDQRLGSTPCSNEPCYVNGTWGLWSSWIAGTCSVTCSFGTRLMVRRRMCDSPPPSGGGEHCEGPSNITYVQNCKVAVPCGVAPAAGALSFENPSSAYNGVAFPTVLGVAVGVPTVITILCVLGAVLTSLRHAKARKRRLKADAAVAAAASARPEEEGRAQESQPGANERDPSAASGDRSSGILRTRSATRNAANSIKEDMAMEEADLTLTYVTTRQKSIDFGVSIVSGSL